MSIVGIIICGNLLHVVSGMRKKCRTLTTEALLDNLQGVDVQFDKGSNLRAMKGGNCVSIQSRESKYHDVELRGKKGCSWHEIKEGDFLKDKRKVNFYVFLTYLPKFGEHKLASFENLFVIIL